MGLPPGKGIKGDKMESRGVKCSSYLEESFNVPRLRLLPEGPGPAASSPGLPRKVG